MILFLLICSWPWPHCIIDRPRVPDQIPRTLQRMNNGQFVNILWQPIHCLVWFGSKALMQSGLLGWFCGEKQETNIDCSFSVVLVTHCTLGEKFNSRRAYNDCCQHLVSWYIKIPCQKHHISSKIHFKKSLIKSLNFHPECIAWLNPVKA